MEDEMDAWRNELATMSLALALLPAVSDATTPIEERVSALKAERPVFMTYWRHARKFLVAPPAPIMLDNVAAADGFVCVVDVYVDIASGRILLVDVLDAPDRRVARALRASVFEWRFHKGETSTERAVLSIPVAFYPKRAPGGRLKLIAAD